MTPTAARSPSSPSGPGKVELMAVHDLRALSFDDRSLASAWSALKRSHSGQQYVAFMRAFVEPEDQLLPVMRKGHAPIGPVTEASLSQLHPDRILPAISAARLSKEFLDSVGVSYRTEGKEIVKDSALARQLVTLFSELIPVSGTDGRVFVISAGETLAKQSGIQARGITGSLIYFRHDPDGEDVLMHFSDAARAHRKTHHQYKLEDTETADTAKLRAGAGGIAASTRSWRAIDPKAREAAIAESHELAQAADTKLGNAQLPEKKRAHELLVGSAGLTDASGRLNPVGISNRLAHAGKNLSKRDQSRGRIGGFNRKDQLALKELLDADRTTLDAAARKLLLHQSTLKRLDLFTNPRLGTSQIDSRVRGISASLGLQSVITRPHLTFRDRIEETLPELRAAAASRDLARGAAAIDRMYLFAKLSEIHDQLNEGRLALLSEKHGVRDCSAKVEAAAAALATLARNGFAPDKLLHPEFLGFDQSMQELRDELAIRGKNPKKHLAAIKKAFDRVDIEFRLTRDG